ncbi:MAG: hypothetical protein ACXWZ7_21005 [Gemmatirosa sp.]
MRAARLAAALAVSSVVVASAPLRAQTSAPVAPVAPPAGLTDAPATLPDGTRRVAGRVVVARDTTTRVIPGTWVTLHRVGSDSAGPLDSVRTQSDGAFAFRYRPTGAADALYFASTSYGGIAYFTPPLRDADVRADAAEITVFDTTSRPVPSSVRGRHLIVAAPSPDGMRNVIEVFELTNDSTVTGVPPSDGPRGTWSVALPASARDFAVRPGEVPDDGMLAVGGRAVLMVPFAPGIKQVAFTYRLPGDAFPLRVALERPVTVLEVLLEEPRGTVAGAGLVAVEAVALEGRTFRRFLAQETPAGASVDVAMPAAGRRWERMVVPALLITLGGAMVVLLLRASRRPPRTVPSHASHPAPVQTSAAPAGAEVEREGLLTALAALDDAFAARTAPSEAERETYARERATLKARLSARLAAPSDAR